MVIIVLRRALDWIQVAENSPVVLSFFFFFNRRSFHPRRPRGRQSGREKRCNNGFQARAEKYKKSFFIYLILCPEIGEQHLLRYFSVFVHDSYCLAILSRFVHQRVKCTLSRNFQFDINPGQFKNAAYPKTKTRKRVRLF